MFKLIILLLEFVKYFVLPGESICARTESTNISREILTRGFAENFTNCIGETSEPETYWARIVITARCETRSASSS